jgi:molybdopterin-binding protein
MKISARNQIPARVTNINKGAAIANVELDASIFPGTWFRVVSSAQMEPFTNRD